MKKSSKLALAALALGLVPFEVKSGEDGSFSYQSLLLGVRSEKKPGVETKLTVSLFNLPDFLKKTARKEPPQAEPEAPAADETAQNFIEVPQTPETGPEDAAASAPEAAGQPEETI